MGTAREPASVKYFAGLLCGDHKQLGEVECALAEVAGVVEMRSAAFPWTFSTFYEEEMGSGLLRRFLSFVPLASPENLPVIKGATQRIEDTYRDAAGNRRVNLDPGYLDRHKVVLASTKNAGQRIYLREGIYAEATLLYRHAGFHGFEYTYKDYLSPQALEFFSRVRGRYLAQLRQIA